MPTWLVRAEADRRPGQHTASWAMRVIVTRPAAQADGWVQALRQLGCDARALPLIGIAPPSDPAPVRAVWSTLAQRHLVMFVSANAVQHFFAARGPQQAWPAHVRAASTGPGTSAALREAGVPDAQLVEPAANAPQFDSEALWALLQDEPWAGRKVLVVRGEQGRDWLADSLRQRGAHVEHVAAYRRLAPQLDADGRALLQQALDSPDQHTWLFSSSEAVQHLRNLVPQADWSRSRAMATHPRIAEAAQAAGFGQIDRQPATPAEVARLAAAGPSIQSRASEATSPPP